MISSKIAHRYAKAFFEEAKSLGELDNAARDMQLIIRSVSESDELLRFLKSQIISRELKKKTLDTLFSKQLSEPGRHLIRLILEKRREDQLPGIASAFEQLYKKENGLTDVEVFVSSGLDESLTELIKQALQKKTGSKVSISLTEDPSLIGGMAVRIGDTVIDGTIKHKLQQLEATFQQAGM